MAVSSRLVPRLVLCAVLVATVAACGRRGALEPPPGSVTPQAATPAAGAPTAPGAPGNARTPRPTAAEERPPWMAPPGTFVGHAADPGPEAGDAERRARRNRPNEPFILDPLLN